MKTVRIKIPAKLNLTLDVLGKDKEYHNIMSLVTSVNVYDYIKITKRKDSQVILKTNGLDCGCEEKNNNAYKACKLFVDRFKTEGVNIYLKKKIPIASGMGGSSADVAGVLKGMKKLFKEKRDVLPLANEIGSDSGYMLNGGYAVISGRGNEIIPVKTKAVIPALIILDDVKISAKEGYAGYDSMNKKYPRVTLDAVSYLINLKEEFFTILKNDLQPYAETVLPAITKKIKALKKCGAKSALMTGSGTAVYGLFENSKERNKAYLKLLPKYKGRLIKCHTIK